MRKYIFIMPLAFLFFQCDNMGTNEQRQQKAEELLQSQCELIISVWKEFTNESLISGFIGAVVNNRCACIKEILIPRMAAKHSLSELEDYEKNKADLKKEIKNIIQENQSEVNKCFSLKK